MKKIKMMMYIKVLNKITNQLSKNGKIMIVIVNFWIQFVIIIVQDNQHI